MTVLTIHADNETALILSLLSEARSRGLNLKLSLSYTLEQNPFAERYGALISAMSRQMVKDAGLPSYLWPEAARTSIYIQNRIPHRSLGWQSPSEALSSYLGDRAPHWLQAKPDLSNLRIFGCKAFVRIENILRIAKLAPRAAIGFLVGYDASNIWRIWIPAKRRVIRARDVEFDETQFFADKAPFPIQILDDSS